jgi:hypothetical protein
MVAAENCKTCCRECVECRQAKCGRCGKRLVAETVEDMLVIATIETITVGNDGIHCCAQLPAFFFGRNRWPRMGWLRITKLFAPQWQETSMIAAQSQRRMRQEMIGFRLKLRTWEVGENIQADVCCSLLPQHPVERETVHHTHQAKGCGVPPICWPAFDADRVAAHHPWRQHGRNCRAFVRRSRDFTAGRTVVPRILDRLPFARQFG